MSFLDRMIASKCGQQQSVDAFRDAMDDDSDASEHGKPIADAHRYFKRQAEAWLTEEGDPEVRSNALSTALHGLFQIVVIDLEPHDNAQVIFETLNARGTPLLAADLVKNHVMQAALAANLDAEQIYHEHWANSTAPCWRHKVSKAEIVRPKNRHVSRFLARNGNERRSPIS